MRRRTWAPRAGWCTSSRDRHPPAAHDISCIWPAAGKGVTPEANELYRILCDYDVDMAIVGHSHRRGPYPPWQRVYRDAKTGKLGLRELWGVVGGTWQRTPDTGDQWSDERRLRPRSTGGVVVEYDPAKGAVRVAA